MSTQNAIRAMLVGGARIAKGRAPEVAELIRMQPRKTAQVVEYLWDDHPAVANRAADALERASHVEPRLLQAWKGPLLGRMVDASENKLRWNLALMIPRVKLTATEADRAAAVLWTWLEDKSSIVKTASMHGLAGLTQWSPVLLPSVLDMARIMSRSGTPAMRARGRILLKRLEAPAKSKRRRMNATTGRRKHHE